MLINIVTKKRFKVIAVFLVVNLIAQIGFPTVAFALTSGPSQPEAGSFEPVNTNQMVDLFSGDFTYNIPLMNVPGPNGGYPINLAYNAGIGMEQEATWVGLGWNINSGAINRNLRGLPDDFSGDLVKKTVHMRPQRKILVSGGIQANIEVFGCDPNVKLSATTGYYYDNYKGVGSTNSVGLSTLASGMGAGVMITNDSKDGLGVSPSISYSKQIKNNAYKFSLGLDFNSRQGLKDITFNLESGQINEVYTNNSDGTHSPMDVFKSANGAGMTFSSSSYVPINEMPRGGFAGEFEMELGSEIVGNNINPITVSVAYNESKIIEENIDFKGYGYFYAENNNDARSLADFNREKDIPVNKNSKSLPIPSATYDVYAVKGQGVGGAFRTFRSDVGVFTDPVIRGNTAGFGFGLEVGTGSGAKLGSNPKISSTESYSGRWKGEYEGVEDNYKYSTSTSNDFFEPAYFKSLGETVSSAEMHGGSQNLSEEPFRFNLGLKYKAPFSRVPIVRPSVRINSGPSLTISPARTQKRQNRVQSIEYITKAEMDISYGSAGYASNHSFTNSGATGYTEATPFAGESHHMEEISVVNPDGNRYVYGLPAYNTIQQDKMFSVAGVDEQLGRLRDYVASEDDNNDNNHKGLNNLYSATELPAYAHSYLLTEVLSPDYVDLTGNGPSDDDLGYWVKFNYLKKNEYRWRAPYNQDKGNNIENKISNDEDDMSGYSYGTKEIMYLESIETKTHVAEYHLGTRDDGLGVIDENGGKNASDKLLYLKQIVLKSKADTSKAIKTVHFAYDYSLCQGIPNNTSSGTAGKLTLKKVWFTYLDNDKKGALSPYEFIYGDIDHDGSPDAAANPNYNINEMDRWGNYSPEGPFKKGAVASFVDPDQRYPYCNQFQSYTNLNRAVHATAWNLTQVIMPSGGILKIDYESDDYAYVQNEPAMQMFKIVGTGNSSGPNNLLVSRHPLSNTDDRIYFELNRPMSSGDFNKCIAGLEDVYFKTYIKLKSQFQAHDDEADDYVEGYAKIINGNAGLYSSTIGWVQIRNVPPGQVISTDINPIKLAGLRELRFNRDDLISGQNSGLGGINSINDIASIVVPIIGTIKNSIQMISGFYNYGIMDGWCDELIVEDAHPSYIRLKNADGVKYGGGCRVAAIELDDNWKGLNNNSSSYESNSYGQYYDYILEDHKTSSGVAEYEPLVGGEENPLRKPIRYSSEQMILKDNALMIEEPFNESLFPSANVGYSRVTVRNKKQLDDAYSEIMKAVSGITVHEFYTARDFPVYTKKTDIDHKGYNISIAIPFVGGKSYKNNGYSQGYNIELNNMHGKPYSIATYAPPVDGDDPQPGDPGVEPVAATYYYYKTQSPFIRYKSTGNKLDNNVTTLTDDAITKSEEIGKHIDTYVDMRENSIASKSFEYLPNMNAGWLYFLAMLQMFTDKSHEMFRSATTNKVITRNGILDKQVTTKEGARTISQNLYYDAATGLPLLATTTNDFDRPIYDYKYAGHWEHEGMKGAYHNIGAKVQYSTQSMVHPGDELLKVTPSGSTRYWVENDGTVTNSTGSNSASIYTTSFDSDNYIKIVRSGYRNQQSVNSGNIVSLSNPTAGRVFPLFNTVNALILSTTNTADLTNGEASSEERTFTDCFDETTSYTISEISIPSSCANRLVIKLPSCGDCTPGESTYAINCNETCPEGYTYSEYESNCFCSKTFICDDCNDGFQGVEFASGLDLTLLDFTNFTLTKYGNKIKASFNGTIHWGELKGLECLNECLPDVLHASSAKFSPSWGIDFADAGVSATTANYNRSRYGADNIWRLHETFLFDIDRKQSGSNSQLTKTGKDGTYDNFALFNWSPLSTNKLWTKTNTITQYSPYGYELENEDALGIKSSALYGYKNSVVTAVASNTGYNELAFDGFEDYSATYTDANTNNGHILLSTTNPTFTPPILVNTESHSGDVAVSIPNSNYVEFTNSITYPTSGKFLPKAGHKYYVTVWVKVADGTTTAKLTVDGVQIDITTATDQKIEGWQRLEGKFTAGASTNSIKVEAIGGIVYLDDIRVQSFKSAMKSYVYDPQTLWLKAELDDRNYATFYNYDEEGNLIQIKKETKDGIRTIVTNRKNVTRNSTIATP